MFTTVRFGLVALLLLAFVSVSRAGDSSSGCGLGWQIFSKNSLVSSALRSTTHAFLPNTFSMTSGTSGCAKHDIVMNEYKAIHFAEANYSNLMMDMARGQGEYLNGFAAVTNYKGDMNEFGSFVQENFAHLYPTANTSASQMVSNFKNLF